MGCVEVSVHADDLLKQDVRSSYEDAASTRGIIQSTITLGYQKNNRKTALTSNNRINTSTESLAQNAAKKPVSQQKLHSLLMELSRTILTARVTYTFSQK
ncbi:hypothetical protein VTP01DRAFT_8825 [Rhizomucor pusillus]|uniref:uncharacterized protein n=1 Tax=Rhizomucor pusillus TaxID=4840 RepID=UPI003743488A